MQKISAPALKHGLDILTIIIREKEIGFNKLQELTNINKNSLNRYLTTLYELSYISKTKENKYTSGIKMSLFSDNINKFNIIKHKARVYLERIENEFNVTALLMGITNKDIYCIDKVTSTYNVSMQQIGSTKRSNIFGPWGILYLITLDDITYNLLMNTVYKDLYEPLDKDKLDEIINFARKYNYADNKFEINKNVRKIAFPIYDSNGELFASLAIGTFTSNLDETTIEELINKMKIYSDELSKW